MKRELFSNNSLFYYSQRAFFLFFFMLKMECVYSVCCLQDSCAMDGCV